MPLPGFHNLLNLNCVKSVEEHKSRTSISYRRIYIAGGGSQKKDIIPSSLNVVFRMNAHRIEV